MGRVFYVRGDDTLIKEFKKQAVEEGLTYSQMFEKAITYYLHHIQSEYAKQMEESEEDVV